jgi:nucleotide-binding universal stress UspA family protein
MFETIVWASDGSAHSNLCLPYVRDLGERYASSMIIVHVIEELAVGALPGPEVHAYEDRTVAKLKAQTLALRRRGIPASLHVIRGATGHCARHVADVADSVDADLMICGSRGRAPASGALLGSFSLRLLAASPCPVLVVVDGSSPRPRVGEPVTGSATPA